MKVIVTFFISCLPSLGWSQVQLIQQNDQWELRVDQQAYMVKGVTWGYPMDDKAEGRMVELKSMGVNSLRLWGTNERTVQLLDLAHKHGMTVMVGIWLRHGKPGMEADDSFDYLSDKKGMKDMMAYAVATVNEFKDHPALLTWGVGNEVYLNIATDEEKKAYSVFLEKVCKKIDVLDGKHPITSVDAWTFAFDWWHKYVPSIDIYGINSYGSGVQALQGEMEKRGIDKPFIVTEFGVYGEWDAPSDAYGVKNDPSDEEKYSAIAKGFKEWILSQSKNLGAYVFHYGDGDDFGATWLLTHFRGYKRPQYWGIRKAYTDLEPENNVPIIQSFLMPQSPVKSGDWLKVRLSATDLEEEELVVEFAYNQRSGTRARKSQLVPLSQRGDWRNGFEILTPKENGPLKIYVLVKDVYGNCGIKTTSINIQNENNQFKNEVAIGLLPFSVYDEGGKMPFYPTAFMGDVKYMTLNAESSSSPHSGAHCLEIKYDSPEGWVGVGFVDPPDDWGDRLGGYNLNGAEKFSFWAMADKKGVRLTIGFGLIGEDQKYYDTTKESIELALTDEWKQYSIDLSGKDLSVIRSGLVLYTNGSNGYHTIRIDDVVFE